MNRKRTPLWISIALFVLMTQLIGLACNLGGRPAPAGTLASPTATVSPQAPSSTAAAELEADEETVPLPPPAVFPINESGATLELEGVFRLEVPEAAVQQAGQIMIETVYNSEEVSPPDPRIPGDGVIFDIHIDGSTLDAPVRITLPIPKEINPDLVDIAIYHLVEMDQPSRPPTGNEKPAYRWVQLPSEVRERTVSAWTDSFSKFTRGWVLKNTSSIQESIAIDTYYDGEKLTAQLTGQYCTGQTTFVTPDETNVRLRVGDFPFDVTIGHGSISFSDAKDPNLGAYCRRFTADVSGSLGQILDDPNILDIHDPSRMTAYVEVQFFHYLADTFRLSGGTLESDKVKVIISKERSRISLTPGQAGPSEIVNISGDQFGPEETVKVYLGKLDENPKELKAATTNDQGHFQTYFYLPIDVPESSWDYITAVGQISQKDALALIELSRPKVHIPDKNGLSVSAQPDPVDAGQQVEMSGYGFREITKVRAIVAGPGNTIILEQNDLEADVFGEVHFSLSTPIDLQAGKYTVTLTSEIDPSLSVSTTFILKEYNPTQCLSLTPVGGEDTLNVVLMETVQEPVSVDIEIKDICLKKQPVSQWQVIVLGPASLAQYRLSGDGSRLTLSFMPFIYTPGTYPVSVGIQYPGKGSPKMLFLEVQVTDLVYKSDNYYESEYMITHKTGKKDEVTDVYQCRRKDEGSASSVDRYLQINAIVTCDEGHEEEKRQWYSITDRISGMDVVNTCPDCYESPGKNPGAATKTIHISGRDVQAYATDFPVSSTNEVNTVSTQGIWEWEGTRTVWTDSVTGMVIGHTVKKKSYFTGTYNGTQITRKDYGHWYEEEYWLVKTSFHLGQENIEGENQKPDPEPTSCTSFMPSVLGMDLQAATAALKQLGYQVIWEDVRSQADQVGLITGQKPDPNTCAVPSRTIVLLSRNLGQ